MTHTITYLFFLMEHVKLFTP
nr:unnamed protein product [Callosobruchus analis]